MPRAGFQLVTPATKWEDLGQVRNIKGLYFISIYIVAHTLYLLISAQDSQG
jgi:hypothetical protein